MNGELNIHYKLIIVMTTLKFVSKWKERAPEIVHQYKNNRFILWRAEPFFPPCAINEDIYIDRLARSKVCMCNSCRRIDNSSPCQ